jgi:hypothetical protein
MGRYDSMITGGKKYVMNRKNRRAPSPDLSLKGRGIRGGEPPYLTSPSTGEE